MRGAYRPIDSVELLQLVREGYTNAQLADHFACTVRTIDRRRHDDPSLSKAIIAARAALTASKTPEHGAPRRYALGCRCRPCTDANSLRCRNERLARRARRGLPPPDPNRGRRRSVAETIRPGRICNPSLETRVAQAIARGESTSAIMQRLGCGYTDVQAVRDALNKALAS